MQGGHLILAPLTTTSDCGSYHFGLRINSDYENPILAFSSPRFSRNCILYVMIELLKAHGHRVVDFASKAFHEAGIRPSTPHDLS